MTKKELKSIIEVWKDETNYFTGNLKYKDMYEMFRYRFNFGEAETEVILAALELAGAKFQH